MEVYSQLFPRALRPYCITSATLHTNSIDKNGIPNTIYTAPASLIPNHMPPQEDKVDDVHNQSLSHISFRDTAKSNDQAGKRKDERNKKPQEYTADPIMRHVSKGRQRKYVCDSMDTRHVTTPWNRQRIFRNTSSTGIGGRSEKRRINAA